MSVFTTKLRFAPAIATAVIAAYGSQLTNTIGVGSTSIFGYSLPNQWAYGSMVGATSLVTDYAGGLILPKIYKYLPFNLNAYQEKMIVTPLVSGSLGTYLFSTQTGGFSFPQGLPMAMLIGGVSTSLGKNVADSFGVNF